MTARVIPLRRGPRAAPSLPTRCPWLSWLVLDELNHAAALAAAQDDSPLSGDDADDERALAAFVASLTANRGTPR